MSGISKGVVVASLALLLVPDAASAAQIQKKRAPKPAANVASSIGSFTPAAADPRFGSTFGRGGLASSGFRFTPSLGPGASRRVTVAVRASRATPAPGATAVANTYAGFTPYAYNLGVAVGWKRFAVTSDYSKVDLGTVPGSHEAADVALSYGGKHWSTRLAVAADRSFGDTSRLIGAEQQAVAVDFGGSYSINSRFDVTGGVRYRVEKDRLVQLSDDRRDSQAVYIGTAFKF
ncbi:hypothetical protein HZF05_15525 [Sphingomonas sp. CGMCC 1.13654]|uniref:Porin n=1 Tax=Sphingomonas chungangi TaxID=2683589 RepID=A0A838L8Z2_9SPHN|nr:hypothetical protein [Sphingomonas chungangi]MBA2935497.1 hypothetical protein [Sphingomonas chungangi]MVW57004.1 hypothetical protein [Sphingomonas chungangi]